MTKEKNKQIKCHEEKKHGIKTDDVVGKKTYQWHRKTERKDGGREATKSGQSVWSALDT